MTYTYGTLKHYKLGDKIGAGGMGTVFRAVDTRTDQTVAIKQLNPDIATPDLIERFRREGEALRQLNHPNIVKSLDTLYDKRSYYLVMEYVSGGDLHDLIKTGDLPLERVLRIAIDLADSLTRAHKLDIIHRDLKPANVLITDESIVKLTDFGIAHINAEKRITTDSAIIGTLDYLAPEILNGEGISRRSDIWAFGVILYEMLSGQHPFRGDTYGALITNILTQNPPDLEALCPDAPVALIDLIYRMLDKDRGYRVRSVRQIGLELEDILYDREVKDTDKPKPAQTRFEKPPTDFLSRPKHNLPAQTTSFVGRESEVEAIVNLLDDPAQRLITILAPGGMGKTRLALAVAQHQLTAFENGVYFVDLAPLGSFDDQLISTMRQMIQMLRSGHSIIQCFDYLAEHAPEPTAGASRGFLTDIQAGAPPSEALQKLSSRAQSRYVTRLTDVMKKQFTEGGNLADRLDELTEELRAELGETRWSNKTEYAQGLIVPAVAEATGFPLQAEQRSPKQQILDFLREKQMFLVMDNYEHLIDGGAELVTEILNTAPKVKILVTSRQKLKQSAESVFNLDGMDFADWDLPDDALHYSAVQLFMQSANRVQMGFALSDDNVHDIAKICRLVQGMPLGILLAASWLEALSTAEIADEISKGFDFLESDMTDLPTRQRSIRAVFDRTWDALSPDEQDVFMKLSVFRGGFTREAGQAVTGANLRTLMSLLNKSLLRRDADTGRYSIHELLRQYGEVKLDESGLMDETLDAHKEFWGDYLEANVETIRGFKQFEIYHQLHTDYDNINQAWQTCD